MTADFKKLMKSLQTGQYASVYVIDGEESFYLDLITEFFEEKIVQPSERDFNLLVLYGKDAQWADVINACRRFPMFAERQVVILKDAAQMRELNELVAYLENPSLTTVLLIEHRFKKVDGRGKLVKYAKEKGIYFTSDKIKDDHVPGWIQSYGIEIGFDIPERESQILATYLGNDLQKIANEIEKVRINVPNEKYLTAELIQKYIGISREYNVFEFPEALTHGDKDKLYRMLAYFLANPKAAPMPLLIGTFYNHFSRIYQAHSLNGKTDKEITAVLGWKGREMMALAQRWPLPRIEYCMMLLGNYSTRAVGIDSNTADSELLKEMIGKMTD
jgi:DNA polymerase-3 subunit delta